MNNNRELKLIKDDGSEIVCEILFTYYSEDFKSDYVIFVVPEEDCVSAAKYSVNENGDAGELTLIDSEEEWEMIEEVLESYYESLENEENEEHGCGCGCGCHGECDDDCDCDCDHENCECDHEHNDGECCCKHQH